MKVDDVTRLKKRLRELSSERKNLLRRTTTLWFEMKDINQQLKSAKGVSGRFSIDVHRAVELCRGADVVARACKVRSADVAKWRNSGLPESEWKGETRYAAIICGLVRVVANIDMEPIDLCPGAGQYMAQPDSDAA